LCKSMFTKCLKSQPGYTLIELVVAMALAVIIVTMLSTVTALGLKNIQASRRIEQLHADSIYATDTMAYYVKQAKYITVPSTQVLNIDLANGTAQTFGLANSALTFNGNPITNSNVSASSLKFTRLVHSVQVAFTLSVPNTSSSLSVQTTIDQRNQ